MRSFIQKKKLNIESIGKDKVINQVKKNVDKELNKQQDQVFALTIHAIKELIEEKYSEELKQAIKDAAKNLVGGVDDAK